YAAGEDYSFVQIFGETGQGPFNAVDLYALGDEFAVPVFIVQGEVDLVTLPERAGQWLDTISAPEKAFVSVPRAGHDPNAALIDGIFHVLRERIIPFDETAVQSSH